ncbi:MAG: CaiB/BaiF CoA transferase family protein [Haloferacaceae archaeon]
MDSPLEGLRVVDFTTMISGPFATNLLADFGADVIAVEHPTKPNPIREWNPQKGDESLWWKSIGRNKRAVTLDLGTEEGSALALELVEDADVVFENFRPGTMERWGLGYDALSDVNPGVVMVRISGYGQTGPRAEKPGFGSIAEAISGWANANGFPDSDPLLPPIPLADLTAAQFAVFAAMFAVYERDLGGDGDGSGEGQVVDVSLYEPLFRLMVTGIEAYDVLGETTERTGNRSTNSAPRNLYETADGYVALSASSQAIFENVAAAIGREDLVDDPRFATNADRVEHATELDEVIESWTRERPTDEVIGTMEAADAIVGPVYDERDIHGDEQYRARDSHVPVEDPDLGEVTVPNAIPRLSRTDGSVERLGPAHGEHNEAVYLDEVGLDREEFERLHEEGVI